MTGISISTFDKQIVHYFLNSCSELESSDILNCVDEKSTASWDCESLIVEKAETSDGKLGS